jgi:hypothetical protein
MDKKIKKLIKRRNRLSKTAAQSPLKYIFRIQKAFIKLRNQPWVKIKKIGVKFLKKRINNYTQMFAGNW